MKIRSLVLFGCVAFVSCLQASLPTWAPVVAPVALSGYAVKLGTKNPYFLPALAAAGVALAGVGVNTYSTNSSYQLGATVATVLAPAAFAGYRWYNGTASEFGAKLRIGNTDCCQADSCYCLYAGVGATAAAALVAYMG